MTMSICGKRIEPHIIIGGELVKCGRPKGHERRMVEQDGKLQPDTLHWPSRLLEEEEES